MSGSGTEAGQIITTTVGGRNGQPKQVIFLFIYIAFDLVLIKG